MLSQSILVSRISVKMAISALLLSVATLFAVPAHAAKDPVYTGFFSDIAVSGYDTVAYFTQGKPVEGSEDFSTEYEGYTYLFSSQANLEAFTADPDAYLPQFGGYCAWAVSQGGTASTNPHNWSITDGKLYLNYDDSIQAKWERDVPGNIKKANDNWPSVLN